MAKTRSPRYPAISLKDAVERVTKIYNEDYQNPIPRAVIASHMGFASLHGKALGILSALGKFGLLEGRGDNSHVSDLAVAVIAHPPGEPERVAALQEAAAKPDLFSALGVRFPDGKASDQAIRSYLLTQKFIPTAADLAIRSYRETIEFVAEEASDYDDEPQSAELDAMQEPSQVNRPTVPPLREAPFRVAFEGDALEVTGRLTTPEDIDKLVQLLQINKVMVTPVVHPFPTEYTDDDDGREAEERDRKRNEEINGAE